jgi:hypothetical protein
MLKLMVAMPVLDSVVSLLWIGGLALVLLSRAVFSWFRFRHATRSALHARRLDEATRPVATRRVVTGTARQLDGADVLAFRRRRPAMPATPKPEVR